MKSCLTSAAIVASWAILKKICKEELIQEEEVQYGRWLRAMSPVKRVKFRGGSEVGTLTTLWMEAKLKRSDNSSDEWMASRVTPEMTVQLPSGAPRRKLFDFIKPGAETKKK
ncbi:unnamed protein product [Linum trigynum]|uniref:Uncharacterized protein n=1 Tax=Linum trigynum TaxID=586398 RepID=A0AAV2FA54_9ROSI